MNKDVTKISPATQAANRTRLEEQKAKGNPKFGAKKPAYTDVKPKNIAKELMKEKFGEDYDKPKQGALSSSAATAKTQPPKGRVFTQSSTATTKRVTDDASSKIEVINKQNPHKPGSNRAQAFDHMLKSKTVGAYLQGGANCKHKYLAAWAKDKLVKLV